MVNSDILAQFKGDIAEQVTNSKFYFFDFCTFHMLLPHVGQWAKYLYLPKLLRLRYVLKSAD